MMRKLCRGCVAELANCPVVEQRQERTTLKVSVDYIHSDRRQRFKGTEEVAKSE